MVEKAEERKISLFYRIILKIPKLSIKGAPPVVQGLFWALICPLFIVGVLFMNLLLLVLLYFPYNYFLAAIADTIVILFIMRILVERALNLENSLLKETSFSWNIDKSAQEYFRLLKTRKTRKTDEDL